MDKIFGVGALQQMCGEEVWGSDFWVLSFHTISKFFVFDQKILGA